MKHYLVFGPPCSGKGTMCKLLQEHYKFNHKSTGDMIRNHQKHGTRIGLMADKVDISSGNFLPDRIVSEMVKGDFAVEYANTEAGFLLDGYPRTIGQAKDITSFMYQRKEPFEALIYFKVDMETLMDRLAIRSKELGRDDDTKETFKKRLDKYYEETEPILDFFKGKGKIVEVDASGTIDEQFSNLKSAMNLD